MFPWLLLYHTTWLSLQAFWLPPHGFICKHPSSCLSLDLRSRRVSPCQFLSSCALPLGEPRVPGFVLTIDNIAFSYPYLYSDVSWASQVYVPSHAHFFLFLIYSFHYFPLGVGERKATENIVNKQRILLKTRWPPSCTVPHSSTRDSGVILTACLSSPS